MKQRAWTCFACALLLALGEAGTAAAQTDEPPARALTGELRRIREAGVVRIGYRQAAAPFSQARPGADPFGYSIDLCLEIVQEIVSATGGRPLRVEYRQVTPEDRLDQVVDKRIDLECGSTSITAERRERVAFSPVIFVAGTRLLVRRGSPIRSVRDLAGRTVVAAAGTTNASAMRALAAAGRVPGLRVHVSAGYDEAFAMLDSGAADALAADDVLLAGFVAERRLQDRMAIVGAPFTHEPYGIAYLRGDPALAEVVHAAFVRLARERELLWAYDKWFLRTLPSGARLGLPMGQELRQSFRVLGLATD